MRKLSGEVKALHLILTYIPQQPLAGSRMGSNSSDFKVGRSAYDYLDSI